MRVFKQHVRGTKTKNWYVECALGDARRVRLPAFRDKAMSEQFGRDVEKLAELHRGHERPNSDLAARIERWPVKMRDRLVALDLLDAARSTSTKTLAEHVEDFRDSLLARGNTKRHADTTRKSVLRVFEAAGFVYWSDIDASKVEQVLRGWREVGDLSKAREATDEKPARAPRPIGAVASNGLLTAVKGFALWMVGNMRATESPLRGLRPLNAKLDRRHERRALTLDEVRALLTEATRGPERFGMAGPERAMLYRVAVETGLRASELSSLTVASFNLAATPPSVTLRAGYSKRRREDVLPLKGSTAEALRKFLPEQPSARAFNVPRVYDMAPMIHEDLAAAGVLGRDENGRPLTRDADGYSLDFHGLRHTMISNLAHGGVEPKTAQTLARHSTITLTLDRYTHLRAGDDARAIEALPDLDAKPTDAEPKGQPAEREEPIPLRRTGSDDRDNMPTGERYRERYRPECDERDSRCDSMRHGDGEQAFRGPLEPTGEADSAICNPLPYHLAMPPAYGHGDRCATG